MGVLQSKTKFPISYDEACKRIKPEELKRIEEAFQRFSSKGGLLPKVTFLHDVLDQTVPPKLGEGIYVAFHGTQKGIQFKDLLCGLVLLVHGTTEEKTKFIFNVYSSDGTHWMRSSLRNFLQAADMKEMDGKELKELFGSDYEVTYDKFHYWITHNPNVNSFSTWLLDEKESGFQLTDTRTTPNYHQTIGDMANVDEEDVIELERRYWVLRSAVLKFDLNLFTSIVSPPVPATLCSALFKCFDSNGDGHIDLPEFVVAISKCCRLGEEERLKFCFQVFDSDGDGLLNEVELVQALGHLCIIREENLPTTDESLHCDTHASSLAQDILQNYGSKSGGLTLMGFINWSMEHTDLSLPLANILFEIGHVKFGLRPISCKDEAAVIAGYMLRAGRSGAKVGDTVYLIANQWFYKWRKITGYDHSYSLLSDSEPTSQQQQPHPHAPPANAKSKARKKGHKAKRSKDKSPVPMPANVTVEDLDDAVDISIAPNDGNSAVGEAVACRNSCGSDEYPPYDPRSTLGQIDNSSLCEQDAPPSTGKKLINLTNEGGRLRTDVILAQHRDFDLLPESVWSALSSWYRNRRSSKDEPPLPRSVISNDSGLPEVEMYPIQFVVYKHSSYAPQAKQGFSWSTISSMFYNFIGTNPNNQPISGPTNLDNPTHPILPKRVMYYQASFDKTTTVSQLYEKFRGWMRVKQDDLRLWNFSDDESPLLLDDDSNQSLIDLGFKDGQPLLVEIRNKDNTWPEEMITLVKELKAKEKKKQLTATQNNAVEAHVPEGATGLSNLGNTCFMNSSLQCISNTRPLTKYFTESMYRQEINKENPLGLKGTMAKRYADLVRDLWSGKHKSIVPLKFRWTIGKYAPQFSGFQQQDAQELLNFVLDGLHEDLNRIIKKPYRELQDSNGRPDEVVANEAWDYHLERNNSIIVDLFQGQLKSKVRCLTCQYTSVKFDPFTFLSLPLPVESKVTLEVIVVRLDGTTPVRYSLREEMDHKYLDLKKTLSELSGIAVHCLQLCEVMAACIRTWLRDTIKISSAVFGGMLYAYEVPEPPAPKPVSRMESPDTVASIREGLDISTEEYSSDLILIQLMQRLKELNAKVSSTEIPVNNNSNDAKNSFNEDSHIAKVGSHDTEEGSHDTKEGSHYTEEDSHYTEEDSHYTEEDLNDTEEDLNDTEEGPHDTKEGSHDSCGPTAIVVTDTDSELHSKDQQNDDELENGILTDNIEQHTFNSKDHIDEHIKKADNDGRDTSPSTPLPTICSAIGSGLYIVGMHRKMIDSDSTYLVAIHKLRPNLFGIPIIIPCATNSTHQSLYQEVWRQIKRLIIPKSTPSARPTEDKELPFSLKMVNRDGLSCFKCPWYRFCRGCLLACDQTQFQNKCDYLAIDWDPTVRHLRYQSSLERPIDHESVKKAREVVEKPIDLYDCLNAFTKEEKLGENETWMCKRCQKHQRVGKRLEIWRLPPVLIVHLKRFQFINNQWTKSQQDVKFSCTFNPLKYRDSPEYNVSESGPNSQFSSKCPTPVNLSRSSTDSMCNLLIQNEGNSCSSTLSREKDLAFALHDEELVLNSAAETLAENLNVDKEERQVDTEEVSVRISESEGVEDALQPDDREITPDMTNDASSPSINGEIAAEITSAKAISVANIKSPIDYDLFAIASHTGVLGGGHYVSYAKNPNGNWYCYNDSSCKVTSEDKVLADSPYLLFYERQNLVHEKFFSKVTKGAKADDDSGSEEGTDDDKCVLQ